MTLRNRKKLTSNNVVFGCDESCQYVTIKSFSDIDVIWGAESIMDRPCESTVCCQVFSFILTLPGNELKGSI